MASRYGKNPIKDAPKTTTVKSEEDKVREARQRSKGSASHKTAAQAVTRNEPTNARGGAKPVSKDANVNSTKGYMKRIATARKKDAAKAAEKTTGAVAKKAVDAVTKTGAKVAKKLATRAVAGPVVGGALLAKDAYDAVVADGKRTGKGGQMQRDKKSVAKKTSEGPKASTVKNRTDKSKTQKKPSK